MTVHKWLGHADAVAHVMTGSIDSVDGTPANNTFTVTRNGKTVSQVGSVDVATTAAALVVLLNAEAEPEFAEITWANPSAGNITATADTAGKPIPTITLTETGAGTGSVTDFSETTANSGPNDASVATNYSGASAPPGAGDTLDIENTDVPILYGLAQLSGTLTEINVRDTVGTAFRLGLPEVNEDDPDNTYAEDRPTYLAADCTTVNVYGGHRVKIDAGSVATTLNVYGTGTRVDPNIPCLLWKGTSTSNVVNVVRGDVGIAIFSGEAATFVTMRVGQYDRPNDSEILIGDGVTHHTGGTISQTAGEIECWSNIITLSMVGGTFELRGAATATTITVDGGTCYYSTSGTCTTLNVSEAGTVDFMRNNQARTITNCTRNGGGTIINTLNAADFSGNGIVNVGCRIDESVDCGFGRTWTPS